MNVTDAVIEYGKEHGYDGLYNTNGECACLWSDFQPCCECISDCEFGYIQPDCPDGYDFWLNYKKPEAKDD